MDSQMREAFLLPLTFPLENEISTTTQLCLNWLYTFRRDNGVYAPSATRMKGSGTMQQRPNSPYHPPSQPLPHQRLWRWFRSRSTVLQLLIGGLVISCSLCTCVMSVIASTTSSTTTQAPTPTATHAAV